MPAVERLLWSLAGQPYWAAKVGSFRMRTPSGDIQARVAVEPDDAPIVELSQCPAGG